jgi:hypothetical protein
MPYDISSYVGLAQSFSPNLGQDGRQVCRPAQRSRVTGVSATYAIFFGHTEIHSWPTSLLPWSELGDKLVAYLMPN